MRGKVSENAKKMLNFVNARLKLYSKPTKCNDTSLPCLHNQSSELVVYVFDNIFKAD